MNWPLHWGQPSPGTAGIALAFLAMALFSPGRWPARPTGRIAVRVVLSLAALGIGLAASLDFGTHDLQMAECMVTLASETGLTAKAALPPNNPPPPAIGLGSGPRGQTYFQIAQDFVEQANAFGVPLVNIETSGTFDNLRRAASPLNMSLVFSQSDALEAATPDQQRLLRMVMSLYQEEVHVLARRTANADPLRRLGDLNGLRVLVSERSDGSAYTAGRLLKLGGVVPEGGKVQAMPATQALCSVLVGKASAMVVVAGQPVQQLRDLQRFANHPAHPLKDLQFLPVSVGDLHHDTVPGVSAAFYEPARIERRSYPWAFQRDGEREQIDTVAVRALLMAYDFSPRATAAQRQKCAAISTVARLLKDPAVTARLCQLPYHRKWCQLDPTANVPGWQPNTCL